MDSVSASPVQGRHGHNGTSTVKLIKGLEHLTNESTREHAKNQWAMFNKIKKYLYSEGDPTLEQVTWGSCGVSALGESSALTRHSPGQTHSSSPGIEETRWD